MNSLQPSVASSATRRPYSRPKLSVEDSRSVDSVPDRPTGEHKNQPVRSLDAKPAPQK